MPDELTLARARRGDADALGELYRAHHPAILRYLRGTGVGDAEDVAAQVWIDAARSLARFRGDDTDLRRWLFTIARRRMIDAHRSRTRRPEVAMAEPPATTTGAPGEGDGDGLGRATALLASLPPAQAEVVVLRVVLGFDVDEVAVLVDRSPGAVRVLAHRGLTRLRELLHGEPARRDVGVGGVDDGDLGGLDRVGRTAHFPADPRTGVTEDGDAAMKGPR